MVQVATQTRTKKSAELEAAEVAKAQAEAEKAAAEAKLANANARKAIAEAKKAELGVEGTTIELLYRREEREIDEISDDRQHVFRYTDVVSGSSTYNCMHVLERWSRLDKARGVDPSPIQLIFTSPGGSVLHGMALFDFIRTLSHRGHQITTTDLGYSASMAGILLQAGDIRQMGQESYFHIHEISTGMVGKLSDLEDEVEFAKKITNRVIDIFVKRSNGKLTAQKLRRMFERKEAWFSSKEALDYGLVDEVL